MKRYYSMRDLKGVFDRLFTAHSDADAIRAVSNLMDNHETLVAKHPGDFQLFFIGSFDEVMGVFDAVSLPVHVVDASALVKGRAEVTNG